jgi:hypothetical protein|tara:strand:- start:176 stop:574 length:399 start_codon:yes stop_codon:yes gene_type:complete
MAKFIKFNIVDSSTPANQKVHLLDVDNISDISYAGQTVSIVLRSPSGAFGVDTATAGISGRIVSLEVSTSKSSLSAAPTITNGSAAPDQAIVKAMTANPGGVAATAQLGKDEAGTPLQMYWHSWNVATNDQV